jgi:hypothetical protein
MQVMWEARHIPSIEHMRVQFDSLFLHVDGLVVGVDEDQPFEIDYHITTHEDGSVSEVIVRDLLYKRPAIHLRADGEGHWRDAEGTPLPLLDGSIDVDITATPFTNTLPIRRLRLVAGEARTLKMAYILASEMQLITTQQRYTCLSTTRYRFEQNDFRAEIDVDAEGVVTEYEGLFSRVWTG